jgi:hypothetical protein
MGFKAYRRSSALSEGREYLDDFGVGEKIVLKWISRK